MEAQKERLSSIVRFIFTTCKTEVFFFSLSIIFLIFSVYLFVSLKSFELSETDITITREENGGKKIVVVDVAGAVERPGVYELQQGARLKDALIMANGIAARADRNYVAKVMNGARILQDGEKLYIPQQGNDHMNQVLGEEVDSSLTESKMININLASPEQLDALDGVGEKTIAKIIAGRPYSAIVQLREKKIVGQAVYDKIKDFITTY